MLGPAIRPIPSIFFQRSMDTFTSFTHILRKLFELTPINWEVVEQIVHGYLMQPVVINHGHGTVSEKEVVKSIKRQYRTLLSQNVVIPHKCFVDYVLPTLNGVNFKQ